MSEASATAPGIVPAIAIVGMAGRFPGARDLAALWDNLRRGVESISRFTPGEMRAAGVDPALAADPRWVPAGGVLADADRFDAPFFHFTPREAELLDPQHRLFLECAWEALEDAGCDPGRFAAVTSGTIGVFGGASLNTYLLHNLLPAGNSIGDAQVAIASDKDFLTTRISYKLNLTGPSLDVQTACSTSLVAVVLACQSLLNYQCDLALAGGVSAREPQRGGYLHQEQGILSPDGHCRPFDAAARGTVPGNGVGMVALKRLEDALAAGDPIRAVIRGAALNNDGAGKVGFTAPGVSGQAEVVAMALAIAGVDPGEIGFLEAHGTATPMGDPIEVRALEQAFRGAPRGSCVLGSIKSNLGHLDAAAGVAGLIKAVLALQHREIPPTLHFTRPNPEIDLATGPFRVNAALEPWESAAPRRAGVSSFGIGGTNAHVVLEEAPVPEEREAVDGPELLLLSARTPAVLEEATARLGRHLEAHPELELADVAQTLRLGRKAMETRRFAVAADREEALRVLAAAPIRTPPAGEREVVFLFPGQGAQHAGMAAGLYEREPAFRAAIDACRQILEPLGVDLKRLLDGGDLAETDAVQPALFAVEYALAQTWIAWGVKPAAVLGHSLGELVAATIAGVFSLPAALRLVVRRGGLMQSTAEGAMLAIPLSEAETGKWLDGKAGSQEAEVAAVNAPDRCVVSGSPEAVERLRLALAAKGIDARPLAVRRAFHSRSLEPVLDAFVDEVRRARPRAPEIPWLSNRTGGWMTAEAATDPAAWGEALRRPVRFSPALAELLRDPRRVLLEVGPGRTLAGLVRRHGGEAVSSLPHPEAPVSPREGLLAAAGEVWLAGVEVDWNALSGGGRLVPLPTYPFERHRYWIEPPTGEAPPARPRGRFLQAPLWRQILRAAPIDLRAENAVWLAVVDDGEAGTAVVQRLRTERLEPVVAVLGAAYAQLAAGAFTVDPGRAEDFAALLAAVAEGDKAIRIVYAANAGLPQLAAALRDGALNAKLDLLVSGAVEPLGGASDPERAALLGVCEGMNIPWQVLDGDQGPQISRPHCRDAPWGVSEAETTVRPPDSPTPGTATAAPETPHGASLQWGGGTFSEIATPFEPGTVTAWRNGKRWREVWEDAGPAPNGAGPEPEIDRLAADIAAEFHPQPAARVAAATDPLVASHAVSILRQSGADVSPGAPLPLPDLRLRLRLLPKHEELLGFLLRVLVEDGLAEVDGDAVRFLPAVATVPAPAEARARLEAEATGFAPLYDLIDHCGRHYPAVLAGEVPGLAVLYPDGSSELGGILRPGEREGAGGIDPARLLLARVLEALASAPRERPLRILEIGGGHGTLTSVLLPMLAGHDVEYWFTDIGRSFVLRAEQRAREAAQGFLRFGLLDVTRDPEPQGFAPGSFDAVVGADVVHATPRLAETLANLRALLAPGGLLGLVETVRPHRWGTLVWGLADGWWSFADRDLRRDTPLLGPEAWEGLLGRCGFTGARAATNEGDSALLVARRSAAGPVGLAGMAVRSVPDLAAARQIADPAGLALRTADPATFRYLSALTGRGNGGVALLWQGGDEIAAAAGLLAARGISAVRLAGESGSVPVAATAPARQAEAQSAIHDRPVLRNPYSAPVDETERAVAGIWSRALGIERIGSHDNFLELGGDSLIGLQVVHAVQARFDLGGRTFSLYEHPTVAAIARFVEGGEGGAADPFDQRTSRGERRRDRSTSFQRIRS
ncbi:MAG TPA: beta-ketoacyl synthase N-terminal-like domain-containing protein [Thermoanaerobaculia bacterium]|nr:beta-ketoacyl synthase N-terminal-like domain-containing protein [Thermoanaerobaculia bacterium]